jgi:hypothetical protein
MAKMNAEVQIDQIQIHAQVHAFRPLGNRAAL